MVVNVAIMVLVMSSSSLSSLPCHAGGSINLVVIQQSSLLLLDSGGGPWWCW
jgi:hypothetical protein